MTDLDMGLKALMDAAPDYVQADTFFNGETDELFFSPAMARQLKKMNNIKMRLNLSRTVVDVMTDRLEIAGITTDSPDADAAVKSISVRNKLDVVLPQLFQNTLKYGDAYLMVDFDDDGNPLLHLRSPLTTRVVYCTENPNEKLFAVTRVQVPDPNSSKSLVRVNIYYPDRIERFISINDKGMKSKDFVPYVSGVDGDTNHVVENPFGFIPVYHFRTAMTYGRPEHEGAYHPQQAINKLAITHLAAVDYMGFPQRVIMAASGTDSSDYDDFSGNIDTDRNDPLATDYGPDLNNRQRVMRNKVPMEGGPGKVWLLPAGSDAKQFEAANAQNFIDSMTHYVNMMSLATRTPAHYFDSYSDRAPSGEALRVDEAPLVKKVKNRALLIGGTLQDCLEEILALMGIDAAVTVHWGSFASTDSLYEYQVVAAKESVGVPTYDALLQAGHTPEQLAKYGVTREQPLNINDRVNVLIGLGKAMQGFGVAVTAGVLSADQVTQIVATYLADDTQLPGGHG